MSDKSLLLIDALALAYRAFHAIPGLATKAGQPTNAVFGFIKMQRQLSERWKPSHVAVVFDGGLPQERMAALPEYKAQRPPMPDPLAAQLPLIDEYLEASRIPAVRIDAEEADDAMASLALRFAGGGGRVLLATHDKDMFQIVDDRITVVSPVKAGESMGPAEIEAKTGVPPRLILEWLALTGDDVDNIPGVPGVGPKTASKLLNEFGGLDAMWSRLGEVKPDRIRDLVASHRATIANNLRVLALRSGLAGVPGEDDLKAGRPDYTKLIDLFERLEFRRLAEDARDEASRLF